MTRTCFRNLTSLFLGMAITFSDIAVANAADGSLDSSFGSGGIVITDFGGSDDLGMDVEILPDGRIIATGSSDNGINLDFALARYNSNGALDTTFDLDGKVTTPIGSGNDYGIDAALQPDGKIVIIGFSYDDASSGNITVLARYNENGSLDKMFGSGGKVMIGFGCCASGHALVLEPGGKILVAGEACGTNTRDFALVRYNNDGSLDTTFDADGRVTTDLGGSRDFGYALVLQPDGKIIVAGEHWKDGGDVDFALARHNPDGSLDSSFGSNGKVITDLSVGDYGAAVALQLDRKVILSGYSSANHFDFFLIRYEAEGSTQEVTIDIKPDSQTNHVNPRSRARIRVAILSTPDFDALTMVDKNTLTFGRTGEEDSLARCKERGRDVNQDGLRDLICEFSIRATAFRERDIVGILKGQTLDGILIMGRDSVMIIRDD